VARAARTEDERLALLERQPGGVADNAAVRDEDRQPARCRPRPEQPPRSPDLPPPLASCSASIVLSSAWLMRKRPNASLAVSLVRQNGLDRTLPIRSLRRRAPLPIVRASARPGALRFRCVRQSERTTGSWSGLERSVAACRRTSTSPPRCIARASPGSASGAALAPGGRRHGDRHRPEQDESAEARPRAVPVMLPWSQPRPPESEGRNLII
jgi:hypothetical protein